MADSANSTTTSKNGMLTRRSILASAIATPATLLPAAALALAYPSIPELETDLKILALLDEWKALEELFRTSYRMAEDARAAAEAEIPPKPDTTIRDAGYDADSMDEYFDKVCKFPNGSAGSTKELKAMLESYWAKSAEMKEEWELEKSALLDKHNVRFLNNECDDLANNKYDIEQLIFEAPAQSAIGMAVKLVIWEQCYCSLDGTHPDIRDAIHAELAQFGVSL